MAWWPIVRAALVATGLVSLAGLVALPSLQVVMRALLMPIVGLEEVTRYLLIAATFVAIPLVVVEGGQIRMEEFLNFTPAPVRRAGKVLILLLSAGCFLWLAWSIWLSMNANVGSGTPTVGIPYWAFMMPALVGFLVGGVAYLLAAFGKAPKSDHKPPAL